MILSVKERVRFSGFAISFQIAKTNRKHPAQVAYLVGEILATCKDAQSSRFYVKVARTLPDEMIFRFLAEIRQDPSVKNRGAVFVAKVKRYLGAHIQHGTTS